jgi:quercetin dioxygenase-like cupin family protein
LLKNDNHYMAHVDEFAPAKAGLDEGWRNMDIRFVITDALARSGNLCLFRTVFGPGAAHERHTHENAAEFLYVIRGRAAVGSESDEYEAVAGTLQYIPAGKIHWLRNLDPDEPVELVGGYVGAADLEATGYRFISQITEEFRKVK